MTDYYFAEGVDDETVRGIMEFANQVGLEDAALVASVQRGLGSGMIPHGRLLLSSEHLIQHFQNLSSPRLRAEHDAGVEPEGARRRDEQRVDLDLLQVRPRRRHV